MGINQRCRSDEEAIPDTTARDINASSFHRAGVGPAGTMRANDGTREAIIVNQAITYAFLVKIKPGSGFLSVEHPRAPLGAQQP